jgi:nucleoside-diphosphate-sugar epimerase
MVVGAHKRKNNLDMIKNTVAYCNKTDAKLIYISSLQVNFDTKSDYKMSKVESEEYITSHLANYTIIRPSAPYGKLLPFAYTRKQPMHVLVDLIRKLPVVPVMGNGKYFRQPVHVSNMNGLVFQCMNSASATNKVFEIGGPKLLEFDAIVDAIATRYNKRVFKSHLPLFIFLWASNVVSFIDKENIKSATCNNEKAHNTSWQEYFDIPLIPFEKGCYDL